MEKRSKWKLLLVTASVGVCALLARRRKGGFTRLEDLMEVPGIGEKKFRRLQGRICL